MKVMLKRKEKFLNLILMLAVLTFIVAAIFKLTGFAYGLNHNMNTYKNTSMYMIETIAKKINSMKYVDDNTSRKLNQMLDKFNEKNNNGLYEVYIHRLKGTSYTEYHYRTVEPKDFNHRNYTAKDGRYISYSISDAQGKYDYAEYLKKTELENSMPRMLGRTAPFIFGVSIMLLSIYFFGRNR